MPAPDPNTRAHLEWLGFIQPNGLVVSAPALVKAGAILNRQDAEGQALLAGCVDQRGGLPGTRPRAVRARLPRVRQRGPRLGLLVQGLRGHGRSSPFRPTWQSFSLTTTRRCTRTSQSVNVTLGMAHRRGNCSCRYSPPDRTSTRRRPAAADWRHPPRAVRSAFCAAPGSPPVCCSTALPSA